MGVVDTDDGSVIDPVNNSLAATTENGLEENFAVSWLQ